MPEGEERAPPGARTMAIVRWALVGLMALAAVGAWVHYGTSAGALGEVRQLHCPMHPAVVKAHEGECPICGMDLVPVTHAPETAEASGAPAHAHAKPLYVCPMDCVPGFETENPAERCPKCGMKLVPKSPPAQHASDGVDGLVPVQLSLDRVQLAGMKTAVATREALSPTLRAVGFVTPNEGAVVSVNARFSGWVEKLAVVQTGQLVERGQILAAVYSPEMLNSQQVFLNAVKWADRRPGAAGASPPSTLVTENLERDARERLALLGVATEDIDALAKAGQPSQTVNVRAPIRGHVARKNVLRGVYVQPGTELFQIADLSTVWVLAEVYESQIGRVNVGQEATLELAAYPGERFHGRVQFVSPALSTGSRTLQARLEFRNAGLKLRPGMYGDVTLALGATEAVVVPREAVVDTGEVQYVFVSKEGGRFEPRRVRRGWEGDGKVALVEGIVEGERVVTTANFLLDSESRLQAAIAGKP